MILGAEKDISCDLRGIVNNVLIFDAEFLQMAQAFLAWRREVARITLDDDLSQLLRVKSSNVNRSFG